MHSDKPPFFIVGSDRSGTTMFRLMLSAHSRLFIPNESWFLTDLLDSCAAHGALSDEELEAALDIVTTHWRWREWELDAAELRARVRSRSSVTLADLIDETFGQALEVSGKPRWGDKTPGYLTAIGRLHGVLPGAKFIHVIRDGRDVCLSLKKTGWRGQTTWDIAQYWTHVIGEGCRQGASLPETAYLLVEYEMLVTDTEAVLRHVCAFLDETFEPSMLEFHKTAAEHLPSRDQSHLQKTYRAPTASDVARWRSEMSLFQVAVFESFAGAVMDAVDQPRRLRFRVPLLRSTCLAVGWLSERSLPIRRRLGVHFPKLVRRL